jgi:integrase
VGKGNKAGNVAPPPPPPPPPPLARSALERDLARRGLPTTRKQWKLNTPLIGGVEKYSGTGITTTRLFNSIKRFFAIAAMQMKPDSPALAEKLEHAPTHWIRHTHATHALAMGAELITVRGNLRHSSVSTTSTYLHADDARRSKQIGDAFSERS